MGVVLIVDDHVDLARAGAMLARTVDCEGIAVFSGSDALRVMSERQVDMVILDYHMPGMSGLDVLRSLRAENVPTDSPRVVMYTADDTARKPALELGAVEFVLKGGAPFDTLIDLMKKYGHCEMH